MSNTMIQQSVATGEQINQIVSKLQPSLLGVEIGHAIIALLSMSLILMRPDLTPEELQAGVMEVSQFMCVWVDGKGEVEEQPKVTLN